MGRDVQRSPVTLAVTILALAFLFLPLLVVVLFSFHSTGSVTLPFEGFSTRWYSAILDSEEFGDALTQSLIVAVTTALLTLALGTGAAYTLTRVNPRARRWLGLLFFLPITLPGLFVGLALLSFFSQIELGLSLTTVVIAHCVFVFPFFAGIARIALERLDPALEESAADLGASPWLVFRRVTLPQVWPVLAAATGLAFMLSFDEFVITFFVIGDTSTLPLYIFSRLRVNVDPTINVVSTLLLGITLIIWMLAFWAVVRAERRRARRLRAIGEPT